MSSKEEELLKQIAELKEQLNSVQEENAKLKSHESTAYSDDLDDFPSKESIWEAMRLVIEYVSERQAIAQVSDDWLHIWKSDVPPDCKM